MHIDEFASMLASISMHTDSRSDDEVAHARARIPTASKARQGTAHIPDRDDGCTTYSSTQT